MQNNTMTIETLTAKASELADNRVRQMKHIPDPVGPGNTVAQGAWGEQTVIVEATWRAVE